LFDFRLQAVARILTRDADAQAFNRLSHCSVKGRHCGIGGGRVSGILAGDHLQQQSAVIDVSAKRSDLIQGGGVGDQARSGRRAVGRFKADDAAERRRLPNGAAGV
jgi:hypothetical protein